MTSVDEAFLARLERLANAVRWDEPGVVDVCLTPSARALWEETEESVPALIDEIRRLRAIERAYNRAYAAKLGVPLNLTDDERKLDP